MGEVTLPDRYSGRLVRRYFLQKNNQCSQAVPVFKALLDGVPNDETAVYNANAGLEACKEGLTTPTADGQVDATPTP